MARDPSIWENPLEFIPERFAIEKDNENFNPFAYIPFSGGFRNCIGQVSAIEKFIFMQSNFLQKFAMLEMKSTVAKVLRNFHLSVENGFEPQDSLELIIKSINGVRIKLEKRNS